MRPNPRAGAGAVIRIGCAVAAVWVAIIGGDVGAAATPSSTPRPLPESAIGQEVVNWIEVSPAYARTGLVLATSQPDTACSQRCDHLWVSHDRGENWRQVRAEKWDGGRPVLALDASGQEVLFANSGSGLLRSRDAGESWDVIGPAGFPTPASDFTSTGTIAAAGGNDYLLRDGARSPIRGSGGAYDDQVFWLMPADGGSASGGLLVGRDRATSLPVIETCNAEFSCAQPGALPKATIFSLPLWITASGDYAKDKVLFVQSGRGIYKSHDGGRTFEQLQIGDSAAVATATPMLAVAPDYSETGPHRTVFVALLEVTKDGRGTDQARGGVYRSDDGGGSWSSVGPGSPLDGGASAVAVAPDGRVFAGYLSGTVRHSGLLCFGPSRSWQAGCTPPSKPAAAAAGMQFVFVAVPVAAGAAVLVAISILVIWRRSRQSSAASDR